MGAFACSGCGACCRRVAALRLNWPVKQDGSCVHLTDDDRCAIYETRPLICRVDEARPHGMSVEAWHKVNTEACEQLKKEEEDGRTGPATSPG